ncbi:MAG: methionyl-tRNA formyltransferase [Patescibacteria group bacterium]
MIHKIHNIKYKFVFWGTGEFAVKILDFLRKNHFDPSLIVTTSDKPKGRTMKIMPTPVKLWAKENNKIILQPEKITDVHNLIVSHYDIFLVADYGKIIPIEILNIPKFGCLNIHPSLLPEFRGPSPIQSFILSGGGKTGVSIILMDEQMDHGPIIASKELEIDTSKLKLYNKELEEKLAELGARLFMETIEDWIEGKIKPRDQNHSQATYTKKITKKDGLIDLNESAEIIERKIRAFTPWPAAYFFIEKIGKKKRIIITSAEIKNSRLFIKKIKPEGKKEMNLEDFLKGNKINELEKYLIAD